MSFWKGFWFWAFWGMCPCHTHIPPHTNCFLDLFFEHYQVLMVVSRQFWSFFPDRVWKTQNSGVMASDAQRRSAQWWRNSASKNCLFKNPRQLGLVWQGHHRIPKAFFKVSKVLWEEKWIKKKYVGSRQICFQMTFQQCSHNVYI